MDLLFFGERKKKTVRKSPKRGRKTTPRRSPKRGRKSTPRRSPKRKTTPRRSPKRGRKTRSSPAKCGIVTLSKLRKLAAEYGISPYAVSKSGGKRSKLVTCTTLKKRLKDNGLEHLYKNVHVVDDEDVMGPVEDVSLFEEEMGPHPLYGPMPKLLVDPACDDEWKKLSGGKPWLAREYKGYATGSGPCSGRQMVPLYIDTSDEVVMDNTGPLLVDPDCKKDFDKFLKANPGMKRQYLGYAKGTGPCSKREFVPFTQDASDDELEDYEKESGFDMSYGRRHLVGGARPRKTHKHVGDIVVKGRKHKVFKGTRGGLHYKHNKTGDKIYVQVERLRKRKKSPKRR